MALYNWFSEGFDPTGSATCITRSQLLQMVHEAKPATGAFMGVLSDTAPDVVTYPDLAGAIWAETSGGNKTGNFFYYDGATWQPWKLQEGTLTGDLFGDHTIDINKLELGLAGYVLGINGAGTAVIYDLAVNFIQNGQLNWVKLQNASSAGKFLLSGGGGVFSEQTFSTEVVALIQDTLLPATHVYDELGTAVLDQVLASLGPGLQSTWKYADQLLRNNTVPNNKLVWGSSLAGKLLKVNSLGTDVEGVAANVGSVAVFSYGGAAGSAPQLVAAGSAINVNFNITQSDTASLMTLAANQFKFNSTGTYLVRVVVPVCNSTASSARGHIIFRNVTTATDVDVVALYSQAGSNGWPDRVTLECVVTPTNTTDAYDVAIYVDNAVELDTGAYGNGGAVNVGAKANRYQRISFTKLA